YFAEGAADRDGPEDYASMEFESEVEDRQVGVGDGIRLYCTKRGERCWAALACNKPFDENKEFSKTPRKQRQGYRSFHLDFCSTWIKTRSEEVRVGRDAA